MKILFGIPDITHRELANLEIDGIKSHLLECHTIHYGPINSKRSYINKIIITFKNIYLINKALKFDKYDLLFLNTAFDLNAILRDCLTLFSLELQNTKVFLKFHGSDPALLDTIHGYKKMLAYWLLKRVHGVGVLSTEEKKSFIEKGFPREKFFIVKNPINPTLYIRDENFRKKMGLNFRTFIFIFIARFLPFKGLMDVLKAIKIVYPINKNIHIFCLGDGPEMNQARQYVIDNDLNSIVTFTGFVPEIETRRFYANADALVFPSSHEGFPMVVFQALAAGIPIITTCIAASADYLDEPDNVLWVEPNSPEQIANSIIRLLNDPSLVKKMRVNNREKALQFTTKKNALEYINVFENIINKKNFF